jgi:hypothetical protein
MLVLLMGGIYELRHCDGLRCHDINAKFHKDWFRHSEVVSGDTRADTATRSHKHTFIFFKIR